MDITELIIKELLESSSSSSDEDEELILRLLSPTSPKPHVKKGFVENVIHTCTDTDFKTNLRMSRETANSLVERYSQSYSKRNYKGGRLQTNDETQFLSFLWFCGNQISFREVSKLFNMSLSNVHACFNRVLNFLVNDMAPEVIKLPRSNVEKEAVAHQFEEISGISNILGCIDGSFIAARTPKNKDRSRYANIRDRVSITIQAICDSKLRFLDIYTGISTNVATKSEIFQLSCVGKELSSLCLEKYYFLGTSGYPLREYLLTSYRNNEYLSDYEKDFNTHHSLALVKIENAFCLLKNRFRQLTRRLDFHNAETLGKFVTACCVLHNICIDREENFTEEISNTELKKSDDEPVESDSRDILLTQLGQLKRDKVKNLLHR